MGKLKKKRIIDITVEFRTRHELDQIIDNIKKMVKLGIENYEESRDGTKFKFQQNFEPNPELTIRFEK